MSRETLHTDTCWLDMTAPHHACAIRRAKRAIHVIDEFKRAAREHPDVNLRREVRSILRGERWPTTMEEVGGDE